MTTPAGRPSGSVLEAPQPPGVQVGAFRSYRDAAAAVDPLVAADFPVERVRIVGCDLRMVEQVLGRRSRLRAVLTGAGSGAWLGLLIGLLFAIVAETTTGAFAMLGWTLLLGAAFGAAFGLAADSMAGAGRDFVARDALVAGRFEVFVDEAVADRARTALGTAREGEARR
ncbi:MAG: general stress protein [Pseudonocardia sp.]